MRTAAISTRTMTRAGCSGPSLHGRAWTAHAEGAKALFDHAVGRLRRNRVPMPGESVMARQVAEVRAVVDKRLHATVAGAARRAAPALSGDLVAALKTPEAKRYPELERMRRPPTSSCVRSPLVILGESVPVRAARWQRPGRAWPHRRDVGITRARVLHRHGPVRRAVRCLRWRARPRAPRLRPRGRRCPR